MYFLIQPAFFKTLSRAYLTMFVLLNWCTQDFVLTLLYLSTRFRHINLDQVTSDLFQRKLVRFLRSYLWMCCSLLLCRLFFFICQSQSLFSVLLNTHMATHLSIPLAWISTSKINYLSKVFETDKLLVLQWIIFKK
jgi:hypothetical protein